VRLSLPDVFVTLQPEPLAVVHLVLAVSFMLMEVAMPRLSVLVPAAISALAVVQHVLLAEMEIVAVLDFVFQAVVIFVVAPYPTTVAWAEHLEVQLAAVASDLFQEHHVQTFSIVKDLTAKILRNLT